MLFLIKYYSWNGNLENEKNQLVGSESTCRMKKRKLDSVSGSLGNEPEYFNK